MEYMFQDIDNSESKDDEESGRLKHYVLGGGAM